MWKKISSILVLALILVSYNHCVVPGKSSNKSDLSFSSPTVSEDSGIDDEVIVTNDEDIVLFSNTVWPITKANCASCHGSLQQPLHASSDLTTAYNAITEGFKVNFSNPSTSRIVLKLKDENHNCWSNCEDNSNEILSQVNAWIDARELSSAVDDVEINSLTTTESVTLSQGLINNSNTSFIKLETASAMIQSPFISQTANGVSYIYAPGTGILKRSSDSTGGVAFYNFSTTNTANYKMWALVDAPSGSDDSFFIKVNNGNFVEWHIDKTTSFEWKEVTSTTSKTPIDFFMSQSSSNRLEVRQREDGAKMSSIIFTEDHDLNSSSFDLNASATFTYDISHLLNLTSGSVRVEVDCREFDEYTYQFFNPRIISNTSLRIKGMKLLINGNYNPQHSTYNYIDTIVTSGTSVLSESALLAIKENGNDTDIFSFSFDVLELQ